LNPLETKLAVVADTKRQGSVVLAATPKNSLDPVLIPISFNLGVAAKTTDPCLLVSATTANFV
jgi:hypothetical protein